MVDLCEKCGHRTVCRFREHYEECLQFIEDVVRCKDCKHWKILDDSSFVCRACARTTKLQNPYDFCSYGERRGGE